MTCAEFRVERVSPRETTHVDAGGALRVYSAIPALCFSLRAIGDLMTDLAAPARERAPSLPVRSHALLFVARGVLRELGRLSLAHGLAFLPLFALFVYGS